MVSVHPLLRQNDPLLKKMDCILTFVFHVQDLGIAPAGESPWLELEREREEKELEKEREREKERDKEREQRERDRQRERDTQRELSKEREREKERERSDVTKLPSQRTSKGPKPESSRALKAERSG